MYRSQFGEHIPLIRRQDVRGFISRRPLWLTANLTIAMIRREVETMEDEARNFYQAAIARTSDAAVRQLLGDLAAEESKHYELAEEMDEKQRTSGEREKEDVSQRRRFVLQIVQPGLAGLMDGSVSTLAPVFAAAFATHASWDAFLVGMAASLGAGISMGFAEALSDDGVLSGRGHPLLRGAICGLMTTAGGIGHTLPFLISNFQVAMAVAVAIVAVELGVIAWVRHRYMDTPLLSATFQVVVGGVLVFIVGILIGSAG
jgi:rubrerythrin